MNQPGVINSIDIWKAVRAILDEDAATTPARLTAEVLRRTGAEDARTALQPALEILAGEFHRQHDRDQELVDNLTGDDANALAREYQRARHEHPDADRDTLIQLISEALGRKVEAQLDARAEQFYQDLYAKDPDDGAVEMFVTVAEREAQCERRRSG